MKIQLLRFNLQSHRLQLEWVAVLLTCALVLWLSSGSSWVRQIDGWLYDRTLLIDASAPHPDILIVAIDDSSLAALGAWPWPRRTHAHMLDELAKAKPKAVLLDMVFSEPSPNAAQDEALAKAMQNKDLGGVVLPVGIASGIYKATLDQSPNMQFALTRSLPQFEAAAAGLGHAHVQIDSDGIVRRLNLWEGDGSGKNGPPFWGTLALAMEGIVRTGKVDQAAQAIDWNQYQPVTALTDVAKSPNSADAKPRWYTGGEVLLPFANVDHYKTVPYVAVLRGQVPNNLIANKYVLVGMTAQGIGDHYPTSVSQGEALMPGVQINATALDGLLTNRLIKPAAPSKLLGTAFIILLVWMVILWRLQPKQQITAFIGFALFCLIAPMVMLLYTRWWWPMGLVLNGLILSMILWSWRRSVVLVSQIEARSRSQGTTPNGSSPFSLNALKPFTPPQASTLKNTTDTLKSEGWHHVLGSLDASLDAAAAHRDLLSNTLQAMPEALLLTDSMGRIVLLNTSAAHLLGRTKGGFERESVTTQSLATDWLQPPSDHASLDWPRLMQAAQQDAGQEWRIKPLANEHNNAQEQIVLLHASPMPQLASDHTDQSTAWIVTLVDISHQKRLQLLRDQALQLLSHDLRAPQSAVLSLMTRLEETPDAPPLNATQADLVSRVRRQVHSGLALADDFVWLLRAQSSEGVKVELALMHILQQVVDLAGPLAMAKEITLTLDLNALPPDEACWLIAERRLIERAFFNLVENAIKYSNHGTEVRIDISLSSSVAPRQALVRIQDYGKGIASKDLPHLFERYRRFETETLGSYTKQQGHGLGLALVDSVVRQHHGRITCKSTLGVGTCFSVWLPLLPH